MITAEIDSAELEKELRDKIDWFHNRAPFYKTWAQSVVRIAKRNARKKSHGGRFWKSIADSVRISELNVNGAVITAEHYAAKHKQEGGTIKAKNAKALTIPVADEAKGKRAAEFETGGRRLFVPKGTDLLGYSANGMFKALFVLRKSVYQEPEPWWPEKDEVMALGLKEAQHWLKKGL